MSFVSLINRVAGVKTEAKTEKKNLDSVPIIIFAVGFTDSRMMDKHRIATVV